MKKLKTEDELYIEIVSHFRNLYTLCLSVKEFEPEWDYKQFIHRYINGLCVTVSINRFKNRVYYNDTDDFYLAIYDMMLEDFSKMHNHINFLSQQNQPSFILRGRQEATIILAAKKNTGRVYDLFTHTPPEPTEPPTKKPNKFNFSDN